MKNKILITSTLLSLTLPAGAADLGNAPSNIALYVHDPATKATLVLSKRSDKPDQFALIKELADNRGLILVPVENSLLPTANSVLVTPSAEALGLAQQLQHLLGDSTDIHAVTPDIMSLSTQAGGIPGM